MLNAVTAHLEVGLALDMNCFRGLSLVLWTQHPGPFPSRTPYTQWDGFGYGFSNPMPLHAEVQQGESESPSHSSQQTSNRFSHWLSLSQMIIHEPSVDGQKNKKIKNCNAPVGLGQNRMLCS